MREADPICKLQTFNYMPCDGSALKKSHFKVPIAIYKQFFLIRFRPPIIQQEKRMQSIFANQLLSGFCGFSNSGNAGK